MFANLVDFAIAENKENREKKIQYKDAMPKSHWLREFCTVHINCGRGTGKTEYITNELNAQDIVIVSNYGTKKIIEDGMNQRCDNIFSSAAMKYRASEKDELLYLLQTIDIKRIFIDEPAACERNDLDLYYFYDMVAAHNKSTDLTFVLLGE
jgi:hypothetical protein